MDPTESMSMVIRAIEMDSTDRVEDIVERLIDLFHSDESRAFWANKMQQTRDGLQKLEDAMEVSLYDGMQAMKQLVTDVHLHLWSSDAAISRFQLSGQSFHYLLIHASEVLDNDSPSNEERVKEIWDGIILSLTQNENKDKASEKLEWYLHEWRQACKLPKPEKQLLENEIRMNFDRDLQKQHSDIENLCSQLRENFEGLRGKLESAEVTGTMVGAEALEETAAAELAVQEEIIMVRAEILTDRKDPSRYPRIENSLFDYIRGRLSDDELKQLIGDERLEKDLCHAREHIKGWIAGSYDLLDKVKIPTLNKEAYVLEAKRTWAFAKALLLGDSAYVENHSELLSKLINAAQSSGADVAPFISIGRLTRGTHRLKFHVAVRDGADMRAVRDLVCDIAKLAGGKAEDRTPVIPNTYGYEIIFNASDPVRACEIFSNKSRELAKAGVCCVCLGDYDINVVSVPLNPDFHRIYGRGLSAPGFANTVFGFLDYSGEKYFCPNGWRRISLDVAKSPAAFIRKYSGWHVAYHGTRHTLATLILVEGFIPKPGAYSEGEDVVYFSPSIEYAAHPRYAKVYKVNDKSGAKKYMQMILQVRINPKNIWKKRGGTLPGAFDPDHESHNKHRDNPPADPNFPDNRNLEWLVKPIPGTSGIDMFKNMFVIYGIMMRVSDTDPKTHPTNAWWSKKK